MSYVRLDDSVMDNPKMLALSDRAFRGWVWGLCYAQRHLTDGYLPLAALTADVKRAGGELQSRGLWEVADRGFQIHDYLKHQDSKAVVELRKAHSRDRQKERRSGERRTDERIEVRTPSVTADVRAYTSRTCAEPSLPLPSGSYGLGNLEVESEGKLKPVLRSHRNCMGLCSERICLLARQFEDFVGRIGGDRATAELRVKRWAEDVLLAWNDGVKRTVVIQGDTFKWWNARYEEWQGSPKAVQKRPDGVTGGSSCGHTPMCRTVSDCIEKTIADGRAQKAAQV